MALRCLRHRKKFGYRKKIRYSWRKSVSVPVSVWEHRIATENRKKGRYKTMYILYNIFKPRSSEDAYAFGMKSKFQELCINKKSALNELNKFWNRRVKIEASTKREEKSAFATDQHLSITSNNKPLKTRKIGVLLFRDDLIKKNSCSFVKHFTFS